MYLNKLMDLFGGIVDSIYGYIQPSKYRIPDDQVPLYLAQSQCTAKYSPRLVP